MKRPNFFIVGAPRCGTTALYEYLNQHPQIYMSEIKEPNHFGADTSFKNESAYLKLFAGAGSEIRLGEATPSYLRSPEATETIYRFDPNAKIIIMLRDPISLMLSSYWHHRAVGREQHSTFAEALAYQAGKSSTGPGEPPLYQTLPLFTEHVRRYFERFGRACVHVIIFDDFKHQTAATYRQTLEFLEVDPDFTPDFPVVNARKQVRNPMLQRAVLATGIDVPRLKRTRLAHHIGQLVPKPVRETPLNLLRKIYMSEQPTPPLDPELRRQLQAEFLPEVTALSELLGRDLTHWCREPEIRPEPGD